jgi:hypothetical protein
MIKLIMEDLNITQFPSGVLAIIGDKVICCDDERRKWNYTCKTFYHNYLKFILPMRPKNCLTAVSYYTLHCYTPMFFHLPCKLTSNFCKENFIELQSRVRKAFLESDCDNYSKGIFVAMLRDNKLVFIDTGIMELAWTCIPLKDLHYYGNIDLLVNSKRPKYNILRNILTFLFLSTTPPLPNVEAGLNMIFCHCNNSISWLDLTRFWTLSVQNGGYHLGCLFKYICFDQQKCDGLANILINTIHQKRLQVITGTLRSKTPLLDIAPFLDLPSYKFTGTPVEGVIPVDGNYLYKRLIPVFSDYRLLGIDRSMVKKYLRIGVNIPNFIDYLIQIGDIQQYRLMITDLVLEGYIKITDPTTYTVNNNGITSMSTIAGIASIEGFSELFPLLLDSEKLKSSDNYISIITYVFVLLAKSFYLYRRDNQPVIEMLQDIVKLVASNIHISATPTKNAKINEKDIKFLDKLVLFMRHHLNSYDACCKILENLKLKHSLNPFDSNTQSWMCSLLERWMNTFQQSPSTKRI